MSRRWFLAICFFWVSAACAAEKPTLAIINKLADPGPGDLLVSKLSGGGFILVERDRLAEVLREQKLSLLSRGNIVQTGKLLGAEALLFLESEGKDLHARFVETAHGERIFDEVFPLPSPDLPSLVESLQERISGLSSRLLTPPDNRLYIALGPISSFRRTAAFQETLLTLTALVGVRLAAQERVILVERENLATVTNEQSLVGKSAEDLAQAGAIIRGRVVDGDATKLRIEFQVQRSSNDSGDVFSIELQRDRLGEAAATIAGKIGDSLGVAPASDPALRSEAPRQYRHGLAQLHAQLFEPALHSLENACLLDPKNETYATAYLGGVARCLLERVGGNEDSTTAILSVEYLFYTDRLRSAISIAARHPPEVSAPLAKGRRVCSFLEVRNDKFDPEAVAQAAACRGELRGFFERFAASGQEGFELLGDWCPLYFDDPEAALVYLRRLIDSGRYPWTHLREHIFPHVAYWNQERAVRLWNEYLDEIQRRPGLDAQFSAVAARCFLQRAFSEPHSDTERGRGRPAAQKLFEWLSVSRDHRQWVLQHENWYIYLRLWMALRALPIDEQDRYFDSVMLEVLAGAKGSEHEAFYYLSTRARLLERRKDGDDAAQIRKFLHEALDVLGASNRALLQETLANLRVDPLLSKMLDPATPPQLPLPEVPGGVLLYDSGAEAHSLTRYDSFAGLVDGDVLWLARIEAKGIAVTRVQISQRKTETYTAPVENTADSAFEQLAICRSRTHLIVADRFRVLAIPVADEAPFLDLPHCQALGPKFGADETAGELQRELQEWKDPHFRRICAVVSAGDDVYVGLDQRTHDDSCRYGAIYRCRPGTAECALICASDSLQPGPLNDCLPYSLVGGCAWPTGDAVYFVLEDTPHQPDREADGQRRGIWRLSRSNGAWSRISDVRLGSAGERPRFRATALLDIPNKYGKHYQFDLGSEKLQRAAGAVSGIRPDHGWIADLEVESNVHYERLYRMTGDKKTRVFSLPAHDFFFSSLIPTENGLIVLLCGTRPGGSRPANRGLAYLLPDEK